MAGMLFTAVCLNICRTMRWMRVLMGSAGRLRSGSIRLAGSLSGPVTIPHLYDGTNHTFFFMDYEGNRRRTAVAQQFLVPTPAERAGDLTRVGNSAGGSAEQHQSDGDGVVEVLSAAECCRGRRISTMRILRRLRRTRMARMCGSTRQFREAVGLCAVQPEEHHFGIRESLSAERCGQHSQPEPAGVAYVYDHAEAAE